MQTLADPLLRRKMPLFDGTMASVELSKPQAMPGFLGKQKLQYNGAYLTYEPSMKDGAGFTPPWNNSKTSLDDRSPVSHLPGMVVQNHMLYRKDSISAEESLSRLSPTCHTPVKKGFMPYTKSPEVSSPAVASPVILRKPMAGGESSTSPSQNPIYIAIPKPVYGLNPCCNELGCVIGQRYGMEHVSPRMPNDWMQTNGHYAEKPPSQRKEALLQQKDLQFECSAEQLKRMTVGAYSPNQARTLPSVIEPSYSYPCTPTRSLFSSPRDHSSQPLQTPSGGYSGLYASHPTYEHKASEVYQECSPMSKYGQLAQRPVFYYSQANGEVESRTQKKDSGKLREGTRVFHKQPLSYPQEHYAVPRTHHTEIPLSCNVEMLPSHSLIRGFDYPCYALPAFHNQIRAPLKRQHSLSGYHSSHIVSPTRQHINHSIAKEKACVGVHVNQLHSSSSYLRVEQSSPIRHVNLADASPSSVQASSFFQPFTGLHVDVPVGPPAGVQLERLLDHPCCEAQVRPPKGLPISSAVWLHRPPGHGPDQVHTAVHHNPNTRKIIYSPATTTGSQHKGLVSPSGSTDHKKCLKRRASHSPSPVKIKEEDKDLYEVECTNKRQKVETGNAKKSNQTDSPPMPVINNVFSLAHYQPQLQELRVVSADRGPQKSTPPGEQEDELRQSVKEKKPDPDDQQPVCLVSKEIFSNSPGEKSDTEVFDPKRVKVEKVGLLDVDKSKESHNMHSKVTIKQEPKDTGSPDSVPTTLKEKCESNVPESKLLHAGGTSTPELKPAEVTTQTNPSSLEDMLHKPTVTLQSQSVTLHPPECKVSFKSIPPHCLKLSTYNIILPDGKHCRTLPHAEQKPSPQPLTILTTRQELQMPARKHFLELHQSLCNLISECVSASPEQDLKNWLSQLEITELAHQSDKVQKVSCLLGEQAREAWINAEIKSALREVLQRLREYAAQGRCPFPHVMRAGAVFLPMLVVKEQLFPTVQSSFIDKVLQEHKVELRPTTLSEEKILIQLHKRACSSRLRRLMSLKHLPDIYTETLNLLYYTCVCKHLGEYAFRFFIKATCRCTSFYLIKYYFVFLLIPGIF